VSPRSTAPTTSLGKRCNLPRQHAYRGGKQFEEVSGTKRDVVFAVHWVLVSGARLVPPRRVRVLQGGSKWIGLHNDARSRAGEHRTGWILLDAEIVHEIVGAELWSRMWQKASLPLAPFVLYRLRFARGFGEPAAVGPVVCPLSSR
jgi:hypothetical protein